MRTALKWYLTVGATILFTLILMSSVTPAISDMALLLNVFFGWFGKFYTIESVILACGFIAPPNRKETKPNDKP